ncbi:MAG: hypothetical protein II669_02975, partial [Elusimicrobia bacterium]|nr:hypothetical protein [Elusimicrobiota bacterium]
MNKKLVSFVLAMVLSVGLGVSSLFAYSYSKYATEFASYYSGSTSKGSVYLTILGSDSADKVLQGNLTAVFGYYAGSLLSYQAAGGQFQLYDSYGARFSCNNDGGIWTVTGVNLRSSDLNEIMKYDTMEDFLMSMGFTEESLAVTQMDEDGNILTTKTYDEDVVADEDINYEVGDTYLEDIKDKDGNVIHKKGDKVKEEDLKDGDETVNIVKYKKGTVLHKKGDQIAVKDL